MKHGYRGIADVAAPLTMYKSMEAMKNGLSHDGALFAWVRQCGSFEAAVANEMLRFLASVQDGLHLQVK